MRKFFIFFIGILLMYFTALGKNVDSLKHELNFNTNKQIQLQVIDQILASNKSNFSSITEASNYYNQGLLLAQGDPLYTLNIKLVGRKF